MPNIAWDTNEKTGSAIMGKPGHFGLGCIHSGALEEFDHPLCHHGELLSYNELIDTLIADEARYLMETTSGMLFSNAANSVSTSASASAASCSTSQPAEESSSSAAMKFSMK